MTKSTRPREHLVDENRLNAARARVAAACAELAGLLDDGRAANVETVLELVSSIGGVERAAVLGKRRPAALVSVRHLAMYMLRDLLGLSYGAIAARFSVHRSAVVWACGSIKAQCEVNAVFAARVDMVRRSCALVVGGGVEEIAA